MAHDNRPLSPDLQIYRPQLTSVLSISHRVTGIALSVGTLLLTGVINTLYLAGSVAALSDTDYGHLLLIKAALFLGMVAIAAVNRLRLTPRLLADTSLRAAQDTLCQLRRNVAIEVATGVIIIAVVAVLGVTPPGLDEAVLPQGHRHHAH